MMSRVLTYVIEMGNVGGFAGQDSVPLAGVIVRMMSAHLYPQSEVAYGHSNIARGRAPDGPRREPECVGARSALQQRGTDGLGLHRGLWRTTPPAPVGGGDDIRVCKKMTCSVAADG